MNCPVCKKEIDPAEQYWVQCTADCRKRKDEPGTMLLLMTVHLQCCGDDMIDKVQKAHLVENHSSVDLS